MAATLTLVAIIIGVDIVIGFLVIHYGRWHPVTGVAPSRETGSPGAGLGIALAAVVLVAVIALIWLWLAIAHQRPTILSNTSRLQNGWSAGSATLFIPHGRAGAGGDSVRSAEALRA